MFKILAAGLPYGPGIFDEFVGNEPLALLKPLHYPPTDNPNPIGSGQHIDFGALTLLLQDKNGGLEVLDMDNWIPIPPNPDNYVVNIGALLDRWTRGVYKGTLDRVKAQTGTTHRYSMPFFVNGNFERCALRWVEGGREKRWSLSSNIFRSARRLRSLRRGHRYSRYIR